MIPHLTTQTIMTTDWNISLGMEEVATTSQPLLYKGTFVPDVDIFMSRFSQRLTYVLLGILIVVGNLLVLLVVRGGRAMRNTTNILVGSLALSDLMIGTFIMPSFLVTSLAGIQREGILFCHLLTFLNLMSYFSSVYSMTLIAIERHHAIVYIHRFVK